MKFKGGSQKEGTHRVRKAWLAKKKVVKLNSETGIAHHYKIEMKIYVKVLWLSTNSAIRKIDRAL